MFCKKSALKNFTKFTGKHLCQSLVFNIVTRLRPLILLEKRLRHRCFPVHFARFLKTHFFRTPLVAASGRKGVTYQIFHLKLFSAFYYALLRGKKVIFQSRFRAYCLIWTSKKVLCQALRVHF